MANITEDNTRTFVHREGGVPAGVLARVSWGSIFAGAVVAIAMMVLFSLLGFSIGFGMVDPLHERNPVSGITTASGIYFIVTQLISLFIGGFVAARLAGVTLTTVAGLHGFSVWAVATIAMVYVGFSGASQITGGLTSMAGSTIGSAGSAIQQVLPNRMPSVQVPDVSMQDLPQPVRRTLEEQGVTPDQLTSAVRESFRSAVSEQEMSRLQEELRTTAREIVRTPGDIGQDLQGMRQSVIGGEDAVLNEQDLNEARRALVSRLPISEEESRQIVDRVRSGIETAIDEFTQAVEAARRQAIEAAQATTDAVSNASLAAFLASLLGLVAAASGGVLGRPKDATVTSG